MRKIFSIGGFNVLRMLRDRSNIFFVFIMPLGLILLIGSLFGGGFTPRLGVVDQAQSSLSQELLARLQSTEGIEILKFQDQAELQQRVERGTIGAGLVIPSAYKQLAETSAQASIKFLSRPDSTGPQIRTTVEAAVAAEAAVVRAARFARTQQAEADLAQVRGLEENLPGIEVSTQIVGDEGFFTDLDSRFELGAASQLLLFMFLTGTSGSAALIQTRRLGMSRRMLSTPTSIWTVLSGEAMGRYGVVLVQGVYIILFTAVAFGVSWGDVWGVTALLLVFGAVAAGTAVLMGSLFRNDQQAAGMGVLIALGLAALGGAMVPLELFSNTMQTVAHFTPHAWALDAFSELGRRDGTITDIGNELLVLAGFALALAVLAAWQLRRAVLKH